MDDLPTHPSAWLPFNLRLVYALLACVCFGVAGCAGGGPRSPAAATTGYRVYFTATRLKDHAPLISDSTAVLLGQPTQVRTASTVATEDTPALPKFSATLTATRTPGMFQLITKTSLREAIRTKKGKLKVAKRDQGALLPLRLGETQNASPAGDPVQIEVRVERR